MQASNDNQGRPIDVKLFDVVAFMTDTVEIEVKEAGFYFPAPFDPYIIGPFRSDDEAREHYRIALTTIRRWAPDA